MIFRRSVTDRSREHHIIESRATGGLCHAHAGPNGALSLVQDQHSVMPEGWLREHGDVLWRYASARAPAGNVEDLLQETLAAALKAWPTFDKRSSVQTWLIGILSHKVADLYRRRARDGAVLDSETASDEQFTQAGKWASVPSDWSRVPDAALIEAMRACRDKLPPVLGDALDLRDLRQLSADAVCQELGITPTNLWTRLHRARLALRRCIEAGLGSGLTTRPGLTTREERS